MKTPQYFDFEFRVFDVGKQKLMNIYFEKPFNPVFLLKICELGYICPNSFIAENLIFLFYSKKRCSTKI